MTLIGVFRIGIKVFRVEEIIVRKPAYMYVSHLVIDPLPELFHIFPVQGGNKYGVVSKPFHPGTLPVSYCKVFTGFNGNQIIFLDQFMFVLVNLVKYHYGTFLYTVDILEGFID